LDQAFRAIEIGRFDSIEIFRSRRKILRRLLNQSFEEAEEEAC
jgi:hypothetical protein